jgi:hypothetical protein
LKGSRENPGGIADLGWSGAKALIWYMVLSILMSCCLMAKERRITLVCLVILFGLFINAFVRIFNVGSTIRETQVGIVEGYKSVNDCVGPFTQIDYEILGFDFDQAVA